MLEAIRVDVRKLSRIVAPGQIVGNLKPEIASLLGLSSNVCVIAGAMDATAAVVAIRSVAPESITEITGAALVIGATCDAPQFDPQTRIPCFSHAIPGKYLLLPWCETAGTALKWYRDQFFLPWTTRSDSPIENLYERITAEAAEAPPGCDGVVLLPHFAGSGCPDFNPAARACIYGLTIGHQRKHISRAFLESIAYLLKRNLDLLSTLGLDLVSVTCSGGGSRSPLWCQIKADVTGLPVHVCPFQEATATGAAMLAANTLGWNADEVIARNQSKRATVFHPNPSTRQVYDESFQRFNWLNERLQTGMPPVATV